MIEPEQYRSIFKNTLTAIIVTDPKGNIIESNRAAERLFGYSEEEFEQLTSSALIDEEISGFFRIESEKNQSGHAKGQLTGIRKNREQFPCEFSATAFTDSNGNKLNSIVLIDITEEIQSRKLLKESNKRYEYVTQATSDAIWDYEPETGILIWEEGFKTIFGYERISDNQGISRWMDKIHPDHIDQINREVQELLSGSETRWDKEYRFKKADGIYAFVRDKAIVIRDQFGKPERIIGAMEDITEQKELEMLLDQANRLAKIGSWEVDLIENRVYFSEITREILEVDPAFEPDLDSGIDFYKEGKHKEKITHAINQGIKEGAPWDLELKLITAKGHEKWVRSIGESELVDGKCVRLYGSFQDIHQRKKAEITLQKAFDEKNEILESIGDCFFAVNRDWTVTYWNHMAEKVLGMPRDKIVGENLWDIYHDAKELDFYTQYHKAMKENSTVNFEEYYPGTEMWFEVTAYPSSSGLSIFFHNITDRKKSEENIFEKSRQLNAIAKFNGMLIKKEKWMEALEECLELFGEVVDADRVYYFENELSGPDGEETTTMKIEWAKKGIKAEIDNPAHRNMLFSQIRTFIEPLSRNEPFNHTVSEITDEDFQKLLRSQNVKSLLALPIFTGHVFRGFIGFDDCTNERIWSDEEISFLQTIAMNLASTIENEDAEIALQKAFDEKNEILESIGDGFFALDQDFIVNYWNKQAEELLFTPKEKILGQYLWDIFDKDQASESYFQYNKALNENVALKFEDYYDPIDKWFDVNVYPSFNGISVFFKDITARKQASERLKELNRSLEEHTKELAASNAELEQFAYVASHDLQEPLRMVTSFLHHLEKKYKDNLDDKANQYIHFAVDGAQRMRQIILDLLQFSRISRFEDDKKMVDLNELVDDYCVLRHKMIKEKSANIIRGTLPKISSYKAPLTQVFHNLIDNALKYSGNGPPEINIRARDKGSFWEFSIEDNGIGIEEEYFDKIFVIFQRLHNKEEYSGTGMGLAIVKKIVENLGGKIWVESESGKGSKFCFTLSKNVRY